MNSLKIDHELLTVGFNLDSSGIPSVFGIQRVLSHWRTPSDMDLCLLDIDAKDCLLLNVQTAVGFSAKVAITLARGLLSFEVYNINPFVIVHHGHVYSVASCHLCYVQKVTFQSSEL